MHALAELQEKSANSTLWAGLVSLKVGFPDGHIVFANHVALQKSHK
jgi:hypothetical protein